MPAPSTSTHTPEKTVWIGHSSQVINLCRFIGAIAIIAILIPLHMAWQTYGTANHLEYKEIYGILSLTIFFAPIIYIYWHWQKVKHHTFRLTSERLIEQYGIFTRISQTLELYRVKDLEASEGFFESIVGCGTIIIESSDRSTPILALRSVKDPQKVKNIIRTAVEQQRTLKGVREFD